jgi:hypothetical protein
MWQRSGWLRFSPESRMLSIAFDDEQSASSDACWNGHMPPEAVFRMAPPQPDRPDFTVGDALCANTLHVLRAQAPALAAGIDKCVLRRMSASIGDGSNI